MPLKDIERVFECEVNTVVTPPFPTTLPVGGTVDLCSIAIASRRTAYLVRAVINWSAAFVPIVSLLTLTSGGFAQVQFEIIRDGGPIARITQTISQVGSGIGIIFNTATTTFDATPIQILDTSSLGGTANPISIFEVRATNIILVPPLNILGSAIVPIGSVTAAVGLVSLVVEEVRFCRSAESDGQ